ncbi:hypothetical protein GUITHDRAFT_70716 [Guillardia theta CCMP2712]|uniref:Rhodanese domain-containing protein n=1 Tax=Guillardia theta (strain CCMP2712) TaxID=905079 RepID=L1JD61_GUITC|nr:hypothetical protein GUITHDRAFT_70716 [Guillardia theta CCMP2712]EKX46237.1 hypothetical protein GUITHDRAFT_70716 [Guillardia theta CCMP2712]|eukprot:XP_005833217.1 hypothetical protein GUITHDRAFT_70716 [Guillardia theta CCMP2712]
MVSFYRLHPLQDPEDLARRLRAAWEPLGVLGRVYVAREGINAQVSVPDNMLELFKQTVTAHSELDGVYLNCDEPLSKEYAPFSKLQIKPRKHVLADGLPRSLDWRENGAKLSPAEWHSKVEQLNKEEEGAKPILIDIRNFYESEVGLFKGAKALDTVTFRDTWDALKETLKGVSKEKEILTYCTGGIRCEKANAYIIQELGYKNVSALRGGIVNYAQYVKEKHNSSRSQFLGVNHVFDQRLGQRVGEEVLSRCINCGCSSDVQTDCANTHCPRPFARRRYIQCQECAIRQDGCCCSECADEKKAREQRDETQRRLEELQVSLRRELRSRKKSKDTAAEAAEEEEQRLAAL